MRNLPRRWSTHIGRAKTHGIRRYNTVFPQEKQATLYKGKAIMAVQKQIRPTDKNKISGTHPVILVMERGIQLSLGNTENA